MYSFDAILAVRVTNVRLDIKLTQSELRVLLFSTVKQCNGNSFLYSYLHAELYPKQFSIKSIISKLFKSWLKIVLFSLKLSLTDCFLP